MVLEDVEKTASDGFSDNPYPTQDDPSASASPSPASGYRFDASDYPKPLPVLGQLLGFSEAAVRLKVEHTLQFAERKVGRQLYPEESQALAYHIYQLEQTKSYFAATGAAAGTWRWYKTWEKMRYPFYQPKLEKIDPNKFAFVRGPMAQYARQTWRFSLYVLVAGQMGSAIGQLLAQPLAAVNTSNDPKLEQFDKELKAAVAEGHRAVQQARETQDRPREFQEQVRNRDGGGPSPQARWGKQPAQDDATADDMSPTGGNEAWGSESFKPDSWESFSNNNTQPTPQRQSTQSSTLPFDDDDASPTGGLFQDEVVNPQTRSDAQAKPGESAWDRLRRGAGPPPLQRPQQSESRLAIPERKEQRDGSTLGDSYQFVQGDEERNRERQRAQEEFDARLERERRGGDFSSDEGKRW